ncbi:unnamed protein product [Paramecium primaurelia]|uniref:Uncharacterized protein n=1 Tax=Paramecium primaurelia TaxID=5886 RepID=A0A8S1LJ63_PARPR|nr:unnamed protein product [Paramecium primaurelia]
MEQFNGKPQDNILITQPLTKQKYPALFHDERFGKDFESNYSKLQEIMDNLQGKVEQIVKSQEDDFMKAYKDQMNELQVDLKAMKRKIDEESLKQKADEKKRILEEERDYFRQEALRLDNLNKEQLRTIEELKFKLKITIEEKNYYEGFVIDSKKENKALKFELLQLYKQKMEDQKAINRIQQQQQSQQITKLNSKKQSDNRPQTQEGIRSEANLLIKDDFNSEFLRREQSSKGGFRSQLSTKNNDQASTQYDFFRREISTQQQSRFHPENQMIEERNNQIAELKQLLQKEKFLCQQLKCELQRQNSQRGELEVILLDCVNQLKKDIASRQTVQKQPFLGNTNKTPKVAEQIAFEDIDYRQFTHQDKKQLLKKFLSSEQFLDQIYQLTFNSQMASTSQLKLNEKWKQDANDATKKFNNFKIYKFRNITSQPIVKQVISKQEQNILSDLQEKVDQGQELVDQIVQN